MTNRPVLSLAVSFLVLGLVPALADTQIIPQVADGAGWSTTIVLANKTSTTQTVTLSFNMDTANGATTPWTPPFVESVSHPASACAAGSTLFLHTPGTSATLTQGWGQVDAAAGVTGYAIFTDRASGPAQDATAPAVSAASRILVPFDNTSGFVSAIAVANPTNAAETVQVNVRTSDGTSFGHSADPPRQGTDDVPHGQTNLRGPPVRADWPSFTLLRDPSPSLRCGLMRAGFHRCAGVFPDRGSDHRRSQHYANLLPQTQVIPQVADGAGWATTIVLTNTTTGDLPVTLNFKQAVPNGAGVTTPWSPPFQDERRH